MTNFKQVLEKQVKEEHIIKAFLEKEVQVLENKVEILEKELKEERGFASVEKQKVENLRKGLMELEVRMKEQRDVFEKEGHFKQKIFEDELKKVRGNYAKELKKERGLMEKKLSLIHFEKREVEEKMERQSVMFENEREAMQKNLKVELEKLRDCHKKELEREIDYMGKKISFAALEKFVLEKEVRKNRVEFEEKMKEYQDMVKKERVIMGNNLKAELEKSREIYEKELESELKRSIDYHKKELEREIGFLRKKLSSAALEKLTMDEEVRNSRLEFEEKIKWCCEMIKEVKEERDIMGNHLNAEIKKSRESYEVLKRERVMSENKLILAELEIMNLVDGLRSIRIEFEEKSKEHRDVLEKESHLKQMMFEDELNKLRGNYKELEHEHDVNENKLVLVELEKMDLVEELSKSRTDFEQSLEVLKGENRDLHKELELYQGTFCSILDSVKHIEQVSNSAISGNVRANGYLLSNCSTARDVSMCKSSGKASNGEGRLIKSHVSFGAPSYKSPSKTERKGSQGELIGVQLGEKSGCSFLENEPEDGSYSENNLKCKRRRIDEGKDDKDAAQFQTGKETTWRNAADMLSAFTNDPELCMAGVVALYRRHIFSGNPGNILTEDDISSATAVARYLVKGDPSNKINRSLLEAQQDCPYVVQTCQRLAIKYQKQLLEIYQKEMDPLFCSKS